MKKPLLVYDGACNFCLFWVRRWKEQIGDRLLYAPFQGAGKDFPEISPEDFRGSIKFILPNGRVYSGAQAVFRALSYAPGRGWMLRLYLLIPGAATVAELLYRFVVLHRGFFLWVMMLFFKSSSRSAPDILTRWVFLRALGVIYFIAFLSLAVQILGLLGSRGILPSSHFLQALLGHGGPQSFWLFPTIFWFNASDAAIQFFPILGAALALLLIAGIAVTPVLITLWILYLSVFGIGQEFLSYQWDILLLEVGFLAIFLRFASGVGPFLFRWLLFRLVFLSGAVKLLSQDPTWKNFTALQFHYETQPLPNMIAWYAHQLPAFVQQVSVGGMFFIQLFVPFLIFAPRKFRFFAAGSIILLELLIFFTGNYTFFNLLTIALCIFLLDDALLGRFLPKGLVRRIGKSFAQKKMSDLTRRALAAVLIFIVFVSSVQMLRVFGVSLPSPANFLVKIASPFHTVNTYGLFAVMTTSRPEIILEGSNDGETWIEYRFLYKADDTREMPRVAAPHQPRLDWQMWFAALRAQRSMAKGGPSQIQYDPWFLNFAARLLEGSPRVLGLLDKSPFKDQPPKYVRALLYEYHFSDPFEKKSQGVWWKRELIGTYLPPVALGGNKLLLQSVWISDIIKRE